MDKTKTTTKITLHNIGLKWFEPKEGDEGASGYWIPIETMREKVHAQNAPWKDATMKPIVRAIRSWIEENKGYTIISAGKAKSKKSLSWVIGRIHENDVTIESLDVYL